MEEQEKADWFLSSLQGLTNKSILEFNDNGIYASDFDIADKDTYWSVPEVKENFRMEDGNYDKDTFDKLYDSEKERLNQFRNADFTHKQIKVISDFALSKGIEGAAPKAAETYDVNPDLWGRSLGVGRINRYGEKKYSLVDNATATGVRQEDGTYVPVDEWTKNWDDFNISDPLNSEYWGVGRKVLKLATNEDDSPAVDENGKPYWVPVKEGEETKTTDIVYNKFSDKWGYYGHDYNWKQLPGFAVKSSLNFAVNTLSSWSEYMRVFMDEGGESEKTLDSFINKLRTSEVGTTERGRDGMMTLENVGDMVGQVVPQLYLMMQSGGVAGGFTQGLTGSAKAGNLVGGIAGRLTMATMAAGDIAKQAREAGYDKKEQGMMLGAYSALMYAISPLSEKTLSGVLNNGHSRRELATLIESAGVKLREGVSKNGITGSLLKSVKYQVESGLHALEKNHALGKYAQSAVTESFEEFLEEGARVGVLATGDVINNNWGKEFTADGRKRGAYGKGFEQFDWVETAKQLGFAAFGGAVGGVVARKMLGKLMENDPQKAEDVWGMVLDGKEDVLYKYLDQNKDVLDLNFQDADGNDVSPNDKNATPRNIAAYNIIKGTVDYMVELRDNMGLKELCNNNANLLKTRLGEYLKHSTIGKDAASISAEILKDEAQVEKLQANENPDKEVMGVLEERIALNKQQLSAIKKGEVAADYAVEGAFNLHAIYNIKEGFLSPEKFKASVPITGKQFLQLNGSLGEQYEQALGETKNYNAAIQEKDASASLVDFQGVSEQGKERVIAEHKSEIEEIYNTIAAHPQLDMISVWAEQDIASLLQDPDQKETLISVLSDTTPGIIDEQTVAQLNNYADRLKKFDQLSAYQPAEFQKELSMDDQFMTMVDYDGEIALNSNSKIEDKINDELEERERKNKDGLSLYSNTAGLKKISKSVQARIAQIKGGQFVQRAFGSDFPVNLPGDVKGTLDRLTLYNDIVESLLQESIANEASAEEQIKKATAKILRQELADLESLGKHIGAEHPEIASIISDNHLALTESLDNLDFTTFFALQRKVETEIYQSGNKNKESILSQINPAGKEILTSQDVLSGQYDKLISTYNYARGILSESSTKLWNAYKNTVESTQEDIKVPSDEQQIVALRAVQHLAGGKYLPHFYKIEDRHIDDVTNTTLVRTPYSEGISHYHSAFVQGGGGTGKTSMVIPLIANIYQQVYGGEVFLTAHESNGGAKISKLRDEVSNYNEVLTVDNGKYNITELISNNELNEKLSLIVYDEATLLSNHDLFLIQRTLRDINQKRSQVAGMPLLSVLYTGDVFQNADVNQANVEDGVVTYSISTPEYHFLPRTKELSFSFRSQNQQLKKINDKFKEAQSGFRSEPLLVEYDGNKGVKVLHDDAAFYTDVIGKINTLKESGKLHEAVFITDKHKGDLPNEVSASGIKILTSQETQGEEWNYVFVDLKQKEVFSEKLQNLPVKKSYYTATTRAIKGLTLNLPANQGITSREGMVSEITPLKPESITKESKLTQLEEILGEDASEVTPGKIKSVKGEAKTMSDKAFAEGKQEKELPKQAPTEKANPVLELLKTTLRDANKFENINLFTFFTPIGNQGELDQFELKRRAIFGDNKGDRSKNHYFLTAAKIGTPQYNNVVNNDPAFNGKYALFLEAEVPVEGTKQRTILGTLPVFGQGIDLNALLEQSGLLTDNEVISFEIGHSFLNNTNNYKPFVNKKTPEKRMTVSDLKQVKGLNFGTVRVANQDVPLYHKGRNEAGEEVTINKNPIKKGTLFIPVSFKHSSSQLDNILKTSVTDDATTFIPLDTVYNSIEEIKSALRPFVDKSYDKKKDKDRMIFSKRTEDGIDRSGVSVFEAFFGRLARVDNKAETQEAKHRNNHLGKALQEIYNQETDADYKKFLSKYIPEGDTSNVATIDYDKYQEYKKSHIEEAKIKAKDAKFLLSDYFEAEVAGKNLALFERAFTDLSQNPLFKKGFRYDPPLSEKETNPTNSLHTTVKDVFSPKGENYNDFYLDTKIKQLSLPSISINKNMILAELERATAKTPAYSQGKTIDGKATTKDADTAEVKVPDFRLNNKTLLDFQKIYFDVKSGKIRLLTKAINTFKRDLYNHLFNFQTGETLDINFALKIYSDKLREETEGITFEQASKLDWESSAEAERIYLASVYKKNFTFLLSYNFPAIGFDTKINKYLYQSSHHKQQGFYDSESFNLLAEGMTEMVKTQLMNTPILKRKGSEFVTTDRFVNFADVEEIISEIKSRKDEGVFIDNTLESINNALGTSKSEVALSVYNRFFNPNPIVIDGKEQVSLGNFKGNDARTVVDALAHFFLSGEIYMLAAVDSVNSKYPLPISNFDKPNVIKQIMQEALTSTLEKHKGSFRSTINTLKVGDYSFNPQDAATKEDVIKAFNALGWIFGEKHLNTIIEDFLPEMGIPDTATDKEQQVYNYLMNVVFKNVVSKLRRGDENDLYVMQADMVYRAVAKAEGMAGDLSYRNLSGDIVYRLRNTSPIFSLNNRLKEIRTKQDSILQDSLLVKGFYNIEGFFLKEGFVKEEQGKKKIKTNNALFMDETIELDLVWGFAKTLVDSNYKKAAMPVVTYSDGSSDITPVISKARGFAHNGEKKQIAQAIVESRKSYYQKLEERILEKWNAAMGTGFTSLEELDNHLRTSRKMSDVKGKSLTKNLMYIKVGEDGVGLKPELIAEVKKYSTMTADGFLLEIAPTYEKFKKFIKDKGIESKLQSITGKKTQQVVDSYFYNYVAFSNDALHNLMGLRFQYKGNNPSDEYIDMVKRAKDMMSNRTKQVFRNQNWREVDETGALTERAMYEGKKLPRKVRVAYMKDVEKFMLTLAGETKGQDVFDGATFALPYTRMMQAHSNGGSHGTNTPAVMKNITHSFDDYLGVKTFIKNAEFTLTEEILKRGGEVAHKIADMMLQGGKYSKVEKAPNIISIEYANQGTEIQIELKGDSGKEFLLTVGRNSDGYNLWSEKQEDGSYKPPVEFPTKEQVQKLVDKYLPQDLKEAIQTWNTINQSEGYLEKSAQFEESTLNKIIDSYKQGKVSTSKLSPKEILVQQLGMSPDYSNIEASYTNEEGEYIKGHFEQMLDILVQEGRQDELIHEVIPDTSLKTGGGAINTLEADNWTIEEMDLLDKGTQLDASHDPFEGLHTDTPTQAINAIGINAKNLDSVTRVQEGLAKLAEIATGKYKKLGKEDLLGKIRNMVSSAVNKRQNISFQHEYVREADFSLDNRQIIKTFTSQLHTTLSDEAIAVQFQGGHYVVHPTSGIVDMYEVFRDGKTITVFKDELLPEETGARKKELNWSEPYKMVDGQRLNLSDTGEFFEYIMNIAGARGKDFNKAIAEFYNYKKAELPKLSKKQKDVLMSFYEQGKTMSVEQVWDKLQTVLEQGNWQEGYTEILLPAEMQKDFDLEPGRNLNEYDENYFATYVEGKYPKMKEEKRQKLAERMFKDFQKRLEGMMIRIPTTGKHSITNTKIVGFMNASQNSVFVPPMFLTIQGADQDIDKGVYLTYEAVNGVIPIADDVLNLSKEDRALYSEKFLKKNEEKLLIAAIKNRIIQETLVITKSAKNTLEANISVDYSLSQLKDIAKGKIEEKKKNDPFSRESPLSQADMHEINQAGKTLVGVFANAQKAYQVMYTAFKSAGGGEMLAGFNDNFNKVWLQFSGLINASTDNAKEQILGNLNIGSHNANIVAYLVATGHSYEQIVNDYLFDLDYALIFGVLKNAQRFEAGYVEIEDIIKNMDNLNKEKGKQPFLPLYKRAEEFGTLANSIMNKELPNSDYKFFNYRQKLESFINKAFKAKKIPFEFDLLKFIQAKPDVQAEIVAQYDKLITVDGEGRVAGNHHFNLLRVLANAKHIAAYLRVYADTHAIKHQVTKVIPIVEDLANRYGKKEKLKVVSEEEFNDMFDFTYGVMIDEYFNAYNTKVGPNNYDLSTVEGRDNFVKDFPTRVEGYKKMFPKNDFLQKLIDVQVNKYGYGTSTLVRMGVDLMKLEEDVFLQLRTSLEGIESDTIRRELFLYSLIVNKGGQGKGSFSQMFGVEDFNEFTRFMNKTLGQTMNEIPVELYTKYKENKLYKEAALSHLSIPYSNREVTQKNKSKDADINRKMSNFTADQEYFELNRNESGKAMKLIQDIIKENAEASSILEVELHDDISVTLNHDSYFALGQFLEALINRNSSTGVEAINKIIVSGIVDNPKLRKILETYYEGLKQGKQSSHEEAKKAVRDCGIM